MVMPLDPRHFERFARTLIIESKDDGLTPLKLRGSQIAILKGIVEAMGKGQRIIKLLKSRQVGASTLSLALDLYWALTHAGIHGAVITDTDSNRESFRTTIDAMLENNSRARTANVLKHNRDHLVLRNRSRLIYQVAGTREGGSLARGKGLNYCHGTEVSSWGNPESVDSLLASFSEKHEHRLYLFESTARGFNLWHDMCREAQRSRSQAFLFVTWWSSPEFCFAPDDPEYKVYTSTPRTMTEREWIREVVLLHKHVITDGQLAWWRWMIAERGYSEDTMHEEFPVTSERAWVMTGSQFFSTASLTRLMAESRKRKWAGYVYHFMHNYDQVEKERVTSSEPQLKVWEEPVSGAYYTLGADPCGGTGNLVGDDAVIEVLRCYGDGVEQVAEFRTPGIPGYCFAWVLARLASEYQPCIVNLEINGTGVAVADELNRIDFRGSYYVYRRADSLGGGGVLHWRTTNETKRWVMEQMRNVVERDMIGVYSEEAVSQMRRIEQTGIYVGGSSRMTGDDCVMGMALAIEAWIKNYMGMLEGMDVRRPARDDAGNVTENSAQNVLVRDVRDMLRDAGFATPEAELEASYGTSLYVPRDELETVDNEEF